MKPGIGSYDKFRQMFEKFSAEAGKKQFLIPYFIAMLELPLNVVGVIPSTENMPGGAAVVVDPGDARPVLEVLDAEGLSLSAILVTHHHADHQGGVADLLAYYPAEVFGPASESITGITKFILSYYLLWV